MMSATSFSTFAPVISATLVLLLRGAKMTTDGAGAVQQQQEVQA